MTRQDYLEAMQKRHAVRKYTARPIDAHTLEVLEENIRLCNDESGLHIQLVTEEPKAFGGALASYGKFSGVRNYIVLAGNGKSRHLPEECGYYGERLVLLAQHLGLNTCWVGLTYKKIPDAYALEDGEKIVCVIAIGYGENEGKSHVIRSYMDLTVNSIDAPDWFKSGMAAVMLAPSSMNRQKYVFEHRDSSVMTRRGIGLYSGVDLGIAKLHFEIGAGDVNFELA